MEQSNQEIEQARAALQDIVERSGGWNDSCEMAAAKLAGLLVASEMEHEAAIGLLRLAGIDRSDAEELLADASRRRREEEDAEWVDAVPVCPHCIRPIDPADHMCPNCNGPVTSMASIDPIMSIHSAGRAYRQSVTGKPRLAVVLAMWFIFGPTLFLVGGVSLVAVFSKSGSMPIFDDHTPVGQRLAGVLNLLLVIGLLSLYAAILWKVTARWLKSKSGKA